ncbi:MAG: histidinol-phosphatase HisJ family protein [Lachnospiraceae bacterium]|nr:histidinol-phosphatase HisJ family protein [Lachnospiraceae bacterium]
MLAADFHLHTAHSADSDEPMERMIESAIEKGLKQICFTEHYDMDFPADAEGIDFQLDTESYYRHYLKCRDRYGDRIRIGFGVEYGLQLHLTKRCHAYIGAYPFDFVIGSSHLVNGKDPYLSEYFEGRSEREAFLEYFEGELAAAQAFDDFDVYGHLDYVVRYGPNKDRDYSYQAYADILDEILKTLIGKGKGIEVNTGWIDRGLRGTNPGTDVLKRYRELGGEILTVGSDAHQSDRIACGFDRALACIREAGFRYVTVFEKRRPEFVTLP